MTVPYDIHQEFALARSVGQHSTRFNVLRWIDPLHHAEIRSGIYMDDLTPCIQKAIDHVELGPSVNQASPRPASLFFPAGVYPVHALKWSGRATLRGEGAFSSILAYRHYREGTRPCDRCVLTARPKAGTRGVGPATSKLFSGIVGLGLVGYTPNHTDMASHLIVWADEDAQGPDQYFWMRNVQISTCLSDAVLMKVAQNLHMDEVIARGVGGHVFVVGAFAPPCPALAPVARGPVSLAQGSAGSPAIHPASLRRVVWRSALGPEVPAGVVSSARALPPSTEATWTPATLPEEAWGAGLLRVFQAPGQTTRLEACRVEVSGPTLSDTPSVLRYWNPVDALQAQVALCATAGRSDTNLVAAAADDGSRNTDLVGRFLDAQATSGAVRHTAQPTDAAGLYDAPDARAAAIETAHPARQTAGICLGGMSLEMRASLELGGSVDRLYQRGDVVFQYGGVGSPGVVLVSGPGFGTTHLQKSQSFMTSLNVVDDKVRPRELTVPPGREAERSLRPGVRLRVVPAPFPSLLADLEPSQPPPGLQPADKVPKVAPIPITATAPPGPAAVSEAVVVVVDVLTRIAHLDRPLAYRRNEALSVAVSVLPPSTDGAHIQ